MASQEGQTGDPRGLGPEALEGLLVRLGPEPDAAAGEYRRLLAFFESHVLLEPERDADETLDRLARKLREGLARRLAEKGRP